MYTVDITVTSYCSVADHFTMYFLYGLLVAPNIT